MNFYRLARSLYTFIQECQETAKSIPETGGHFDLLDPLMDEYKGSVETVFKRHDIDHCASTNYRVDAFLTEKGDLQYAFYSPETEASIPAVSNGHYRLAQYLEERLHEQNADDHLDYKKRWCGFYSRIMGNVVDYLILYGQSSDYPHTQYSEEVAKRLSQEMLLRQWGPDKVIIIDRQITVYTKKSFLENYNDEIPL